MNNLKIEYVDGQLVTVVVEGVSMLDAGFTGLSFDHFLGKQPHLKFEVEGGRPVVTKPLPQPSTQEGELLPAEIAPRPQRNSNRNRNRSH
ncbi:hypothetical protein HV213_15910 [Klebsiella sp. RHBSTW-00484]|nr:hypothetical protein [Klebsiella sp. RHBSTW-00465]QLO39865.1 hypothetical protein HV213_15910 [Klebsiella sp. RHBSTW-00484]QLT79384.1 hypothetical protein HV204_15910 [Klebsiella sp. RHBSTW-00464]